VVGVLAACIALVAALPGWGTGLASVQLLNLADRDAVVLDFNGEAPESTLTVHKLNPSRLELMFQTSGELPTAPQVTGNLVTGVQFSPREDGFLLTLNLSPDVPVDGSNTFYREERIAGGRTVLEVFAKGSSRSPFKPAWLAADEGAVNVVGAAQAEPVRPAFAPSPLAAGDSGSAVETTAPASFDPAPAAAAAGFTGAAYDARSMTLTLRGVSQGDCRIVEQSFPPRVDIQIPGAKGNSATLGIVHKNLRDKVTNVEVLDARSGSGLVVRTTLMAGMGLTGTEDAGGNLVLTFGQRAAASQPAPALDSTRHSAPATPAAAPALPRFGGSATSAGRDSMIDSPSGTDAGQQPAAWTPAAAAPPAGMSGAAGGFGGAMSASAGSGVLDTSQLSAPTGLDGMKQLVPSVDEVMAMAQKDAQRYMSGTSNRADTYGNYKLPSFEGDEEHLSEVRVNLNAAGGFNLYQFIMFLSNISGISIIIDPYWFDDPTGNPNDREPLEPGEIPGEGGGSGFRPAGVFDPGFGATGTVRGNFDNVPFDQALDMVLKTHNLEKVVYRDKNDPYAKPVILITSKARLEYELEGTNEIDLYQLHYADPNQLVQILDQLNLLPLVDVGWYVYQGGGNSGNGGFGGGGNNGGGGNRGGNGGGGNRGGNNGGGSRRNSADGPQDAAVAGGVRTQIFDPLQIGAPTQVNPGGGSGGGNAGGGGGGRAGGGGNQGGNGGQGGGNNQNGLPVSTAKAGLVVMRGTPQTLNTVQSLIAKIDKPPKQVALNVKIYQVSDEPQNVWGLIAATAQKDRIQTDYELGSLTANVLPKGGVLLDENYTAAFDFLQSQRKAKIISEQSIAVLDGFSATFNDSRTQGELVTTLTFDANNNPIRSAQFNPITVGNNITFTPQVDDRGRVTLSVNIDLSSFSGPEQIAPDGNATFQPTRQTDLNTVLRMVDGQTALIAGVTNTNNSYQFQGIPYLSRLPFIGKLFGRNEKTNTTSHLFILIQMQVIDDK
jgi:hypothetical protein